MSGHDSSRGGWSIRALMLVVVALPLSGVFWFALHQVDDARREVAANQRLDEQVELVSGLTQLQVGVLGEIVWISSESFMASLNIDPSLVAAFTGLDIVAEAEADRLEVDRLVAELGRDDLAADLASARADADAADFEAIAATVFEERTAAEQRLMEMVGDRRNGSALLADALALQESADLWLSSAEQLGYFFPLQLAGIDSTIDPLMLARAQARHDDALLTLEELAQSDPALGDAVQALVSSDSHAVISSAIDGSLDGTLPGASSVEADSISTVLEVLRVVGASGDAHSGLLTLTAQAAEDQVALETAASESRQLDVWLALSFLVVASAAPVAIASAQISRPLKALAASAQALSDGQAGVDVSTSGPREVRIVGDAIAETSHVLAVVERQAEALAAGDVDHVSLSADVPGQLGASLEGALGKLASSLTDRAEFEQMLWHEAHHDALTGLANRRAAVQHLEGLRSAEGPNPGSWSVLLMDLDGFKAVNDRFGHQAGDEVLRVTSERLLAAVRPGDFLGRLGGDEFVAVLQADRSVAESVARRIVTQLALPIVVGSVEVAVAVSVGIAESGPASGVEDLLARADAASYSAKRSGGNAVAFSSPSGDVSSPSGDVSVPTVEPLCGSASTE